MNVAKEKAEEIIKFLKNKGNEQILIVGPDPYLIQYVIDKILSNLDHLEPVYVNTKKEIKPENKIFLIDINLSTSMQYQSVLYYYLELSKKNCIVILTSTSVQCLNTFEKRVKSRFQNKIFVIGYKYANDSEVFVGDDKENLNLNNKLEISNKNEFLACKSTVQEYKIFDFMKKYQLSDYTVDFICEILEPLHFVILIIMMKRRGKIRQNQIFEIFKSAGIRELHNSDENDVLYAYYDLMEFGWINVNGEFMISTDEFRESVNKRCPQYIKELFR